MILGLSDWNADWEVAFTKEEIFIAAVTYGMFGLASYLLFLFQWADALLYYNDALKERHENIEEFNEERNAGSYVDDIVEEADRVASIINV